MVRPLGVGLLPSVHNEDVGKRHYPRGASVDVRRVKALGDLFGDGSLDRLVGRTREVDPHLAKLRCLSNVGVVGLLGVLRLDLERLLSRLGAHQLPECAARVFERGLGIVGNLGGNDLKALVRLT